MNLLESAGFSRSNPYYVVQQGKVFLYYYLSSSVSILNLPENISRGKFCIIVLLIDSIVDINERL